MLIIKVKEKPFIIANKKLHLLQATLRLTRMETRLRRKANVTIVGNLGIMSKNVQS